MSESYHTLSQVQHQSRATAAKQQVVDPVSDAFGAPDIASSCLLCGSGFTDSDLATIEWTHFNQPAHSGCLGLYIEERNQFTDALEAMRGA